MFFRSYQRPVGIVAGGMLAALLPACSSFYVHDDAVAKSTAAMKSDFDGLKIADVFDREAAYLDQFEQTKRDTVIAGSETLRTRRLLLFLHGDETRNGAKILDAALDDELNILVGRTDSARLLQLIANGEADSVREAKTSKSYDGLVARYKRAGGTNDTDCDNVSGRGGLKKDAEEAATLYGFIVSTCRQLDEFRKARESSSDLSADAPVKQSAYTAAKGEVSRIAEEIKAKKNERDQLAKALDQQELEVRNELTPAKTEQSKITELRDKLASNLKSVNPYVKQYISDKIATQIEVVLVASQPSTDDTKSDLATRRVRAAIGLLDGIAGVTDAFANPPLVPHPNALAVSLSHMKYLRDEANAQVAYVETRQPRAQSELDAVIDEVRYLSKAKQAAVGLAPGPVNTGLADLNDDRRVEIVYAYSKAWTDAYARYRLLAVDDELAARRFHLDQSRRAATAWSDMLKPGFDTLASSGAGGFDPNVFAAVIGALGAGALIGR